MEAVGFPFCVYAIILLISQRTYLIICLKIMPRNRLGTNFSWAKLCGGIWRCVTLLNDYSILFINRRFSFVLEGYWDLLGKGRNPVYLSLMGLFFLSLYLTGPGFIIGRLPTQEDYYSFFQCKFGATRSTSTSTYFDLT